MSGISGVKLFISAELPGVAAHFVIDENGTIYQQVPLDVRARHTVGLDWCAVGIEFVQPAASGPAQAIAQIFARPRQVDAGLRLVAWLQATYDITLGERHRPRHGQRRGRSSRT